jgi:hypothetical protein
LGLPLLKISSRSSLVTSFSDESFAVGFCGAFAGREEDGFDSLLMGLFSSLVVLFLDLPGQSFLDLQDGSFGECAT